MKAKVRELRRLLFDFDFQVIVNEATLTNSVARKLLFEVIDQEEEVNFYIGSAGIVVIENKL